MSNFEVNEMLLAFIATVGLITTFARVFENERTHTKLH